MSSQSDVSVEQVRDKHIRQLTVEQRDGFWCTINLVARVPLASDELFDILIDPDNYHIFRSIKGRSDRKLLKDDGRGRQEVEVRQVGLWRFGPFRGSFPVKLFVVQDKRKRTMSFRLLPDKRSFMRDFTGEWTVQPYDHDALEETAVPPRRHWGPLHDAAKALHRLEDRLARRPQASLVQLRQSVQPAFVPPPPLEYLVKKITAAAVKIVMEDLVAEAERRNAAERQQAEQRRAEWQQQRHGLPDWGGKRHLLAHIHKLAGRHNL